VYKKRRIYEMDIAVKTKNLTKNYGKHIAVNNVNMEVKQGEIYGLVGKNGAGKTTLMRMFTGLSIPTKGELEMFSESSEAGLNKSRMRTGSIIETPSFFPYLSAKKNLEYYRIQRGIPEKNIVEDVLKEVGLDQAGSKKFKNFSLGMKQRLGLALAIMASPDLLILDEPINGLDPAGIVEIRELLFKLNREKNVTIIISSHILSELAQLATTYGFIDQGEFIEQISSKELEEKCKNYLAVKVDDAEKASVVIEKELQCSKYDVLNGGVIRMYEQIDNPEILAEALISNGIKLYSLNQNSVNLEDYFINLIGGNKNA
jgi:ABC-2 type transport system ATP-binding protein